MRRLISAVLAAAMLAVMLYSGVRLWQLDEEIKAERSLHIELLRQKPEPSPGGRDPLAALRAQNADIVGWIAVPYTSIDYPFVQSKDNGFYLRRDLNGESAKPGTVFMDYRCAPDGTGYSILYGHNMKSGAMFGTLGRFEDPEFFAAHPEGSILLKDGWHTLQFFAFLVVRENDSLIYSVPPGETFFTDVQRRAEQYRDIGAAAADRVVALSTCSYEFKGARMVLLGKIL